MEFTTRWLGERVLIEHLQDGGLFVVEKHDRSILAIKASANHEQFAVVLKEYGQSDGDQVPRLVYLDVIVNTPSVRGLRGGELSVEPLQPTAATAFQPPEATEVPYGSVAMLEGGGLSLKVMTGAPALHFDLATGKAVPDLGAGRIWIRSWRLVWRFGDDEMELCRFG